ncbi:DUF1476 domain-containing protein (plasmid) [Ensifer adhaerens]|uniref:ATPase inhibitor subunit zeta n=1 Tax=Ensifer adhaerens TaxID=106592 RepID=UPI001CBE6771|nr:ATPase inhibitor subunit zeta [Ensifer adhaerens]MBZ7927409.1 DUF1476 domain-containing protein [Ensifer adhaerens]UAX97841.1 DUF1476 domain-containing protein [Ensifer adhaerens]UAY05220.1 DUF1476 domain-containing protein [Ensifer adhaerens]UAY12598.1 DUF1476 domain-containing protein [Ensifer adhaerens]
MAGLGTDVMRMARRNKLVGIWAADKLALTGESAIAYSNELAMRALDFERNDLLAIIRKDFEVAGVVQSDEQILDVMNLSWLEAGKQTQRADASDVALVQIARNLSR